MNDSTPIFLKFGGEREAELALEMLRELGYPCGMTEQKDNTVIHVHVDNQDLVSALEIAQAYGGSIVNDSGAEVVQMFDYAYTLNEIPIPAHIVNEDLEEDQIDLSAHQTNEMNHAYAADPSHLFNQASGYEQAQAHAANQPDSIHQAYSANLAAGLEEDQPNTLASDEDLNGFDAGVHL